MNKIPDDIKDKLKAVIRRIEVAATFDGIGNDDFNVATSVAKLAEISGISERGLRDYFKLYVGQNPASYTSARRAEYAARIFRLFPQTSKFEAARVIGFNCPNGIYGLMRKNGVDQIDSLRNVENFQYDVVPYRIERLQDCVMFYRQENISYEECSNIKFERDNWDVVESYVNSKFPKSQIIAYIGFAIDRYIANDTESGVFIAGILYRNIEVCKLNPDIIGDIGWRLLPTKRYVVFEHHGIYDNLDNFYRQTIYTLNQTKKLKIDISIPFMEKYLNSPTDTPKGELITELWIPIKD